MRSRTKPVVQGEREREREDWPDHDFVWKFRFGSSVEQRVQGDHIWLNPLRKHLLQKSTRLLKPAHPIGTCSALRGTSLASKLS